MPYFVCRATGADCDYYYKNDEFNDVLITSIKHAEEQHPENVTSALEKVKVAGMVSFIIGHIKP